MKNTTKIKNILQLYTLSLDMDDDANFLLTAFSKRTGSAETFVDKKYSVVIGKAFSLMMKQLRNSKNTINPY